MATQDVHDITIVGGGPSGLFAAFYAGLRAASTRIIDSLPQLGGQLAALYPDKYIYDIPGFPKVQAQDLVNRQVEQAMAFSPSICLNEKVVGLRHIEYGLIELGTDTSHVYYSKAVILAAGIGAFVPRTLDIPDLKRLEGRGVHYFISELQAFRDKRVLVVGGGDTALDWTRSLLGVAKQVTLIHRRGTFRAHEQEVKEALSSLASVLFYYELKALHGVEKVEGATIFDNRNGQEMTIDIDSVVLGLGFLANLGPIQDWGLEITGNSIKVDKTMQTNLPGVYAVGDIATYEGKIKLIATATAEAAVAANYAKSYVDPASKVTPGHSSERDQKR